MRAQRLGRLLEEFQCGVEMAVIAWVYVPKFGWTGPGYEYALMWGLLTFAIALRGGGPHSVDRRLGWEI